MNYWTYFPEYATTVMSLWIAAPVFQLIKNKKTSFYGTIIFVGLGCFALSIFASLLWINLERPPLRTLGETRLWYSIFTPLVGLIVFIRRRYKWLLNYSLFTGTLFLIINYANPETYNKELSPALQSIWFVPHVLVYIFAYALLAVSSIVAGMGLVKLRKGTFDKSYMTVADDLVGTGTGFLTLGLLFGALWAKEAWGHYWTWDPKETWALLTWFGYLLYIHIHYKYPERYKPALIILVFAFVILIVCWFGLNRLPSAAQSVHTY